MRLSLALAALLASGSALSAETITPPSLSPPDTWLPRSTAELRVLDKVSALATSLTITVGDTGHAGPLSITLRACDTRPPDLPADNTGFLDITDSHGGAPSFHGWMFSGEPSIGMLEHPVYDVRLIACR